MNAVLIILSLIIGYLLGSLNGGVIVSRFIYRDDVRKHGSGNAGTTNMLRSFGKKAAVFTFCIDFLKGIVSSLIAGFLFMFFSGNPDFTFSFGACLGGAGAILGHNWPLFFGFKGGKGVLTTFACMLIAAPLPALISFALFIIIVASTRYVSLGSILAAFILPFTVFFLGGYLGIQSGFTAVFVFCVLAAMLLIIRHHGNIARLIKGTESKLNLFGNKKKGA